MKLEIGHTYSVRFKYNEITSHYNDVLLIYEDELGFFWGTTNLLGTSELVQVYENGGLDLCGDYVGAVDELWAILKLIKGAN